MTAMESREGLEKRVAELEKKVAAFQAAGYPALRYRSVRKRASWGIGDIPFYQIALGPDLSRAAARVRKQVGDPAAPRSVRRRRPRGPRPRLTLGAGSNRADKGTG